MKVQYLKILAFLRRKLVGVYLTIYTTLVLCKKCALMRPGLYLITGKTATKWECRGTTQDLRVSKGSAFSLIIPIFSLKKRSSQKQFDALCLGMPSSKLYFDFSTQTVIRIEASPVYNESYEQHRRILGPVINDVSFEIFNDRSSMKEQWIEGKILKYHEFSKRQDYVSALIRDLIGFAEIKGVRLENKDLSLFQHNAIFLDALKRYKIPINTALKILRVSPNIPSHGDLGLQNIVVTEEGYRVIDWDYRRVGCRPVWYDILSLLSGPQDADLRCAWLGKGFEGEVRLIHQLIGTGTLRDILIVLPLAWSIMTASFRSDALSTSNPFITRWCDAFDLYIEST